MYSIERDIPIPPPAVIGRIRIYPFYDMNIGDSFLVPNKSYKTVYATSKSAAKRTGFRFTIRSVESGIRVWRTE